MRGVRCATLRRALRDLPRSCRPEEVVMSTETVTTPGRSTLQQFTLDDLAPYTAEQSFGPTASPDFRVFYVRAEAKVFPLFTGL